MTDAIVLLLSIFNAVYAVSLARSAVEAFRDGEWKWFAVMFSGAAFNGYCVYLLVVYLLHRAVQP